MFLAPAFFLGLLAIGVPLWLHRFARANPQRHPFASLMLMQASQAQRSAQHTLRYWLLLCLRILLLVALVLAFAGPQLPAQMLSAAGAPARLHAIVLDTSLSMQYGTRWTRAIQTAQSVLNGLHSSDRVMLVTAAGSRVQIVHGPMPASDAGAIHATLRSLKPGLHRLDYGVALSTAEHWLGSPRPPVTLHLISDLQRSAAPLRFADLEPPAATQLVLHDVGRDSAENAFIESVILLGDTRELGDVAGAKSWTPNGVPKSWTPTSQGAGGHSGGGQSQKSWTPTGVGPTGQKSWTPTRAGPTRGGVGQGAFPDTHEFPDTHALQVLVRSTTATPLRRNLSLLIDGKKVAERGLEIPAVASELTAPVEGEGAVLGHQELAAQGPSPATAAVIFTGLTLTAGTHRIEVRLEPGDALPHDDHFRAVIEHANPKALLLTTGGASDEAAFFAAAIGSSSSPRLSVEQRAAAALSSDSLQRYSLVVIADLEALPATVARRLVDYVAAGGAILATLGAGSGNSNSPLLQGWRVGKVRARTVRIGEIATTHPVLREADDWHRVRFFRQRAVTPASGGNVLITHEDGTPLLVEHEIGAGRALVMTQPIARDWSDIAIHPLFVRFVTDATRYLVGSDAAAASTTVGAITPTGLSPGTGGQIFDPRGARVLGLSQGSTADPLIPDQAGFYEIRGHGGARWLAVNVDSRESDLTALPAAFVQRWQALRVRERPNEAAVPEQQVAARSLASLLMGLAAALVLAELLLANRHLSIRREVPK